MGAASKASCRLPKEFRLAERDKHMSEQIKKPSSYMQELDKWIEEQVIEPLQDQWSRAMDGDMAANTDSIKRAIKQKVLESYRNGQKAGAPKGQWPRRAK